MLVNVCDDLTPAQALRSMAAIAEECEVSRWNAPVPPEDDVLACALLACRDLADVSDRERDHTVSGPVRARMLSTLAAVHETSTRLLRGLEDELGEQATIETPGWASVLDVLGALAHLGQLGGLLWGDGCDSTAEVVA